MHPNCFKGEHYKKHLDGKDTFVAFLSKKRYFT